MAFQLRSLKILNRKFFKFCTVTSNNIQLHFSQFQLLEVGRFEEPRAAGSYMSGQLFLHKVFAYRGIILFPWLAELYDRDGADEIEDTFTVGKLRFTAKRKQVYYYQVLVDLRDQDFMSSFTQNESVTYLGKANDNVKLQAIPGLDFVSHNDILPYSPTGNPFPFIHHELLNSFFVFRSGRDPCCVPRDTLKAWQAKNTPWLKLSRVHKETTDNIRVTAIPYYIGYHKTQRAVNFWWRYSIRLENLGKMDVQLRAHYWRLFSRPGLLETMMGPGVVGLEPFLCKKYPVFQYSSHISLFSSGGYMWGTYTMEKENGTSFECRIPTMALQSKEEDRTLLPF